jgi:hypothetical protein
MNAKSSLFEARSWFDLREFSPGDELEVELIRSKPERFEFLVSPPEKVRQLHLPRIPGD